MKAVELIAALRIALAEVKSQGQTTIPVDGLENYLDNAEHIANDNQAQQVETAKLDDARAKFQHDFEIWKVTAPLQNDHKVEMFKSVIEAGQTALKSATLINGGAAVALLAFLGNLLTKEPPAGTTYPVPALSQAMLLFVIGVGCAGLASGLRYLSQKSYAGEWRKTGNAFSNTAIIMGFSSFALFFWGGIEAYLALR